jgi:uncharacterized membrane protein YhiD involved in acid resistance
MNEKEAAKHIQEAAVGISVAIDELATLKLAIVEQSIQLEKVLALQKEFQKSLGRSPEAIEEALRKIDAECRQRVLDRLRRDPKSSSGGEGESPGHGPN